MARSLLPTEQNIRKEDENRIVPGADCSGEDCDNIVWGTAREGTACGAHLV